MEKPISKNILKGLFKEKKRKKDDRIIIYYIRLDQSEEK